MPNLIDDTALEQSFQAAKDYTDKQINSLGDSTGLIKDYIDNKFNEFEDKYHPGPHVIFSSDLPRTITPVYTNAGVTLQYSLDKKTWIDIASKTVTPSAKTIYMRGQATDTKSLFTSGSSSNRWIFSGDATNKLYITGNLNYLLCDTLGDTDAPIAIGDYCYQSMFSGCTSLVTAPALPATTLMQYCYQSMFSGCTSLVTAPALPATTLMQYCYQGMLYGCTSLVTAPELPATTLAITCYASMFRLCTSLVTAPELPATTLVYDCYSYMFQDCTSLSSAKIHATTTAPSAFSNMLSNVKNTGTLTCKAALTTVSLATPPGWTRVNF